MANYTDGVGAAPIDISDNKKLWGGNDKTNGVLHKNVDGRIPALKESWARIVSDLENPISADTVVPWGNGLWLDQAEMVAQPHTLHTEKPTKGIFAGTLLFEQGWQAGNPVQNYGLPTYSKGTIVREGLVGYKVSMAAIGQEENYFAYLKADPAQDIASVRKVYKDWMEALAAAADGAKLGVFFADTSGFPVVTVVPKAQLAAPALTGATFGGFAVVWESENECVYFSVRGY